MSVTTQHGHAEGIIDLARGDPGSDLLPAALLRDAAARVTGRLDPDLLQYGFEPGDIGARAALATWLADEGAGVVAPERLFLTAGASVALHLLCTLFTRPGDRVLVADPTYHLALAQFADHGLRVEGIASDADGVDPEALDGFFVERLWVSVMLALAATLITLLVAVPYTFLLTRRPRRRQVAHLVLVLATLSLSEVIVAFAWSLLLSRTSGVSNLFAALGLMAAPVSWSPGLWAVVLSFVFLALPLAVLSLYPTLSRLEQELPEAAGTMGAPPLVGFVTVVLPLVRRAVAATGALVFIFVLGAYVIPQTLGRPAQWTIPVHITDQAIMRNHLPLAASLAIVLLVVSSLVALAIVLIGSGRLPKVWLPGRAR